MMCVQGYHSFVSTHNFTYVFIWKAIAFQQKTFIAVDNAVPSVERNGGNDGDNFEDAENVLDASS